MKKAFVLFIISIFMMQYAVFADSESIILVSESFDNCITGALPDFYTGNSGKGSRVVETVCREDNKVLMLNIISRNVEMENKIKSSMNYVFYEMDIKTNKNNLSGTVGLYSPEGVKYNTIRIEDSILATPDKQKRKINLQKGINLKIRADLKNKLLTYVVDGETIIKDYASNLPDSVSKSNLILMAPNMENTCLIDNLHIYTNNTGEFLDENKFPKQEFNPTDANYEEDAPYEDMGDTVFVNESFEDIDDSVFRWEYMPSIFLRPQNGTAAIKYDDVRKSKYLYMAAETGDISIDIGIGGVGNDTVYEADVSTDIFKSSGLLFGIRDQNGNWLQHLPVVNGCILDELRENTILELKKGTWYRIAYVLHMNKKTYDVYINGRKIMDGESYINKNSMYNPYVARCVIYSKGDGAELKLDNIRVYSGKEPRDIAEDYKVQRSYFEDDTKYKDSLDGFLAVYAPQGIAYAGGEKILMSETSETSLIKTDDFKRLCEKAGFNAIQFENEYTDIKKAAENAELSVYDNSKGLYIIGNTDFSLGKKNAFLKNAEKFVKWIRPRSEEIKNLFENKNAAHPRIILNADDFAELHKRIANNDAFTLEIFDTLKSEADAFLNVPVTETEKVENEMDILGYVRDAMKRIRTLAIVFRETGEEKYLDRCREEMNVWCNVYRTWNPTHFLDVGEMTGAIATGYDWLYDYWTAEEKQYMEKAIMELGLKWGKMVYSAQDGGWGAYVNNANNWNGVCNSGMIMGACAIADIYPEYCADIISDALRSFEYSAEEYAPYGSFEEGSDYWEFATSYWLFMFSTLENSLGTDLNFYRTEGFPKTAPYMIALSGINGMNNFHDSRPNPPMQSNLMWLANIYNQPDIGSARLMQIESFNLAADWKDLMFYKPEYSENDSGLPLDTFIHGMEISTFRSAWKDKGGLYLSAHAGSNNCGHGQIDDGTFVLDMIGERWASDMGAENYNADGYFGAKRFRYYRGRPEGHNCIVIDPDESPGQEQYETADIIKYESAENEAFSVYDMSRVYRKQVSSYNRGFKVADNRQSVIIQDEINFRYGNVEHDVRWFWQTICDVEIQGNDIILSKGSKKVKIKILTDGAEVSVTKGEAKPLDTSPTNVQNTVNSAYTRIQVKFKAEKSAYITAKVYPLSIENEIEDISYVPMSEWTAANSAALQSPYLTSVFVNGSAIKEFDENTTVYTVGISGGEKTLPQLSYTVENGMSAEVFNTESDTEVTRIKVSDESNPMNFTNYYINWERQNYLKPINGKNRLQITGVTASSVPQSENTPQNTADNSLGTKWAAEGMNEWIEYDLGTSQNIESVDISFSKVDRVIVFKILVSDDGENYREVYSGGSHNLMEDYETYPLENCKARYVRIVVSGKDGGGGWTSVHEVAVIGGQED